MAEILAAYTMGGRWSPNEDRPMHAALNRDKTLCGCENIEIHSDRDAETGIRGPVLFAKVSHKCKRCERAVAKLEGTSTGAADKPTPKPVTPTPAPTAERPPRLVIDVLPSRIGRDLLTQDNRITANPIFVVEQRVRDYGMDPGYADEWVWHNADGDWEKADEDEAARLDALLEDGEDTGSWERVYYQERWQFVTACLTERGCEDYIALNGHNLTDPRIFVHSGHRNHEWQAVREHFMALGE